MDDLGPVLTGVFCWLFAVTTLVIAVPSSLASRERLAQSADRIGTGRPGIARALSFLGIAAGLFMLWCAVTFTWLEGGPMLLFTTLAVACLLTWLGRRRVA